MTDKEFIQNRINLADEEVKQYNKELCEKYPFLEYDDEYLGTWLDDIPDGWRLAFGIEFCEELRNELIKYDFLEKFRILQLKEKYAEMRCYSNGYPAGSKVDEIIEKYTDLSRTICINCGKPATYYSLGWILPYCLDCIGDLPHKNYDWFVEDKEWK